MKKQLVCYNKNRFIKKYKSNIIGRKGNFDIDEKVLRGLISEWYLNLQKNNFNKLNINLQNLMPYIVIVR